MDFTAVWEQANSASCQERTAPRGGGCHVTMDTMQQLLQSYRSCNRVQSIWREEGDLRLLEFPAKCAGGSYAIITTMQQLLQADRSLPDLLAPDIKGKRDRDHRERDEGDKAITPSEAESVVHAKTRQGQHASHDRTKHCIRSDRRGGVDGECLYSSVNLKNLPGGWSNDEMYLRQ